MVGAVGRARDCWVIIVITDVKTQPGRVDVAVAPQEEGTKDWLSHDIKDTIENSFRIGCNNIAALTEAPGDRVE